MVFVIEGECERIDWSMRGRIVRKECRSRFDGSMIAGSVEEVHLLPMPSLWPLTAPLLPGFFQTPSYNIPSTKPTTAVFPLSFASSLHPFLPHGFHGC